MRQIELQVLCTSTVDLVQNIVDVLWYIGGILGAAGSMVDRCC